MATTLTNATQASHPLDPEYVLAGRPLRPDCTLEQTSRFHDDIWRLGPAINSESSLLKILNFAHEVVPVFVEFEVAVPHLRPAGW
jgi:hypothetical protein